MTTAVYEIKGGDYERGGAASRAVKQQLKQVGADPAVVRRAMIAAYAAEMNVVIHPQGGELRACLHNGQLDIEVIDTGPGIADVEQALREGYSTASPKARELGFGAGMGLPNIKRNSDRFAIESALGRGTRVSFTILLKPQALYGAGRHSVQIVAERCRQSLRCLRACPTGAVRAFRGKPEILDYLCIDCTACIAACPTGTLMMSGTVGELKPAADTVLVVPAAALVQYGAGVTPQRVLDELTALGFREVRVVEAWEEALRAAVVAYAKAEAPVAPVISPACPAVVNLIETRFPSLIPHLAPFLSAIEAVRGELGGRQAICVALCPCQKTALRIGDGVQPDVLLPAVLRAAVMPRLNTNPPAGHGSSALGGGASADVLRVAGLRHVVRVLEAIEDGLVTDVPVIEPWICDKGCFGSPLLAEDAVLARSRWQTAPVERQASARAVRRNVPFEPRKGLRLDNDMTKAIHKLARIDKLKRSLPGGDCGICGAPTCAALAEDIVLGRAHPEACPRQGQSTPPSEKESGT